MFLIPTARKILGEHIWKEHFEQESNKLETSPEKNQNIANLDSEIKSEKDGVSCPHCNEPQKKNSTKHINTCKIYSKYISLIPPSTYKCQICFKIRTRRSDMYTHIKHNHPEKVDTSSEMNDDENKENESPKQDLVKDLKVVKKETVEDFQNSVEPPKIVGKSSFYFKILVLYAVKGYVLRNLKEP